MARLQAFGRTRTPEQVRAELFKAGWKPSMAGKEVEDDKIRALLLELNQANVLATQRRLKARDN
jgi:hypothetical protein